MPHINDDKLIQYQFDLLEEGQKPSVEAHLADCADCRAKLEQLQNRYASLDILGDEIPPSEALIQKTLQSSRESRTIPFPLWKKIGWGVGIAAMILIGVLLVVNRPDQIVKKSEVASHEIASKPSSMEPLRMGEMEDIEYGVKVIPSDQIPESAPFAPASAIELVVLPRPDQMQLTIYNSADLTLVRDTRKLTLKAGWNWLQFMWSGTLIDPTSLSIRPLQYADKIETEQLVYPARLKDIGRWLIRSEVEGAVPFEITYFTSGLSWRAFYMGTMNEGEDMMDLRGYVRVQNDSGEDYENARTRLIVGQVHLLDEIAALAQRRYPYGPDFLEAGDLLISDEKLYLIEGLEMRQKDKSFTEFNGFDRAGGMGGGGFAPKEIAKEGLSEYFLYTIEGTETIPNEWAKRLPSLDVSKIPIESLYKYDEDRYGGGTIQFVSFANDEKHELGDTPLPDGSVKIFHRLGEQGNLSYVGGTEVKYIPVNEEVELNLGPSRLVTVEPKLMDTRTDNYTFDTKGNIDGWDQMETWKIEMTNTRQIPAKMEITRNFNTESWDLELTAADGIEYKKHDVTRARFTATLPPRTKKEFSYEITRYIGKRQEMMVNQKKGER